MAPRPFFLKPPLALAIFACFAIVGCFLNSQTAAMPAGKMNDPRFPAEMLLSQGHFELALNSFKELLDRGHADPYIFRGIVKSYRGADRMKEAESFIKQYLIEKPGTSAAQYGLGYHYFLIEEFPKAEEFFQRSVLADPKNALAWNNWGVVDSANKSYPAAVEKVHKAMSIDPSEPMFFKNLEIIYREMGSPDKFRTDYEAARKKGDRPLTLGYGKALARSMRQEGFKLYAQGELDQCIQKFKTMVALYEEIKYEPGLVPGYFSLGLLYEEKGDPTTAEKYFRDVLAINPNHIQAREKVKQKTDRRIF